ncbi:MAG: LCP family protein [Candidatus Melainabacteria bacterium]|nr:LCP family protein [Candidatus Melainabacteria bacterium]
MSWQVLMSVTVGVCLVCLLVLFVGKPHAKAFSVSLIAGAPALLGMHQSAVDAPVGEVISVLPRLNEPMTVLVMGVDSNGQDTQRWVGTRSDTMMVVGLNPVRRKVGVVSIPRDSRIKINGHGTDKINSTHALGGPRLAIETVEQAFGVHIDRFVAVDTQGLKKLFEIVGPVEVLVENRMRYRDRAAHLNVDLEPGLQALDSEQAEEYVRFRHDARGDLGRIERQQWFVRQVMQKLKEPQVVFKLPRLAALAHEYVVTDLSIEDMVRLASFLKDIEPNQVETATLPGNSATIGGGSYWLPDLSASQIVFERLVGPLLSPTLLGQTPALMPGSIEEFGVHPRQTALKDPALKGGVSAERSQTRTGHGACSDKLQPIDVAIKYPVELEELAQRLEVLLADTGFKVRYKWQTPVSECQHEQIVQNSTRADDLQTKSLKDTIPVLATWPVVVALESRPLVDFTLVISQTNPYLAVNVSAPRVGRHFEPIFFH